MHLLLAVLLSRSRLMTTQGVELQLVAAMQLLPTMPAHMVLQLRVLMPMHALQLQRQLGQMHCLQL
jgi:hypothetical protein